MPISISRREFAACTAAALGTAFFPGIRANEPFNRPGRPRLLLGLAAYGFRDFFKDANHPQTNAPASDKRIDMFQFVDYCAEQDCAAEITSYYFPASANAEFFLKLKQHAFVRGVELSGTAVGNTFTHPEGKKARHELEHVKQWIDHAALMGVPHIRVFAGNLENQTPDVAKKNCIQALEECCAYAAPKGVFLGIENHGGIVAEPDALLEIISAVKSPWLGINLDTGNFHTDDPYRDVERCAPYAVNVQVKTEIQARGQKKTAADLKRLVKILRGAHYQGYVVLEYEAAENPYQAVPRALSELRALI